MKPIVARKHLAVMVILALGLSACSETLDMGRLGGGAGNQTAPRPEPDARGVITYATYEVALATSGETVAMLAARLGQDPVETARLNGISPDTPLRSGELIVLPGVGQPGLLPGEIAEGPLVRPGNVDISAIAGAAIDDAEAAAPAPRRDEPIRHRVVEGETARAIARRYGISLRALAEWNSLGSDFKIRTGQILLIPGANSGNPPGSNDVSRPGQGTQTPAPPSAATPLPVETATADPAPEPTPEPAPEPAPTPEPVQSAAALMMPVQGSIIRDFEKGKSDGIDIAATAGAPVVAAGDGTVAAITLDTEGVPILVLRHTDGLLSVYAGIDAITVARGDTVTRGQQVAVVRAGSPAFVHFETRQGFDAVDPMAFLN